MRSIINYFKLKILLFKIARHIELLNSIDTTLELIHSVARTQGELDILFNIFNTTHKEITLTQSHFLSSKSTLAQMNFLVTRLEETLSKINKITGPVDKGTVENASNTGLLKTFTKLNHLMFTTRQYIENQF